MENTKINAAQALNNLYIASTRAFMSKSEHDACLESLRVLQIALAPKTEKSEKSEKVEKRM